MPPEETPKNVDCSNGVCTNQVPEGVEKCAYCAKGGRFTAIQLLEPKVIQEGDQPLMEVPAQMTAEARYALVTLEKQLWASEARIAELERRLGMGNRGGRNA